MELKIVCQACLFASGVLLQMILIRWVYLSLLCPKNSGNIALQTLKYYFSVQVRTVETHRSLWETFGYKSQLLSDFSFRMLPPLGAIFRFGPCAYNSNLVGRTSFVLAPWQAWWTIIVWSDIPFENGHYGQHIHWLNLGVYVGGVPYTYSIVLTNRCKPTIICHLEWRSAWLSLALHSKYVMTLMRMAFEWYGYSQPKTMHPQLFGYRIMRDGLNGEWSQRSGRCDSVSVIYLWHSRRADGYQNSIKDIIPLPTHP